MDRLSKTGQVVLEKPAAGAQSDEAAGLPPAKKGGLIGTLVRLVVSVGAIGAVLAFTDFGDAIAHARTQVVWLVLLAAACMAGQLASGTLRWHSIRRAIGADVSFVDSLQLFLIGSFFGSYVLTGLSGDVMRVVMSIRGGVSAGRAMQSVVFDRVAVLAAISAMVILASPWLLSKFGLGAAAWTPLLFAAGLGMAIIIAAYFHRLPANWFGLLPMRLLKTLSEGVHAVFKGVGCRV